MFKVFLYLCFQLWGFTSAAQNFHATTFSAKDGLVDDHVTAVIKDERQLLWLGTPFGINWFDGKVFYEPALPARTGQLYVTGFYKDNSGSIWTLTFYNGIYKFVNGKFINFLPNPDQLTSNRNNVFSMLQTDSSVYLVGTDANIFWFDGKAFTHFDVGNAALNVQVNCLVAPADKSVLIGTDNGLWQYTYVNRKPTSRQLVLEGHKIFHLYSDGQMTWVATNKGLYRYEAYKNLSMQSPHFLLAGHSIFSLNQGKDGIWITAEKTYYLKDSSLTSFDESNGLPVSSGSVYYDLQGLTWFISAKGLTRLEPEYYRTTNLSAAKGHPMIITLEMGDNNDLWLGSYGGLTKRSATGLISFNDYNGQKLNYISWIKKLKNGSILAGTEAGIMQITGNKVQKKYGLVTSKAYEDIYGNLWLGTINGRLFKISGNTLQEIKLINNVQDFIDAILIDSKGFLWIGYRNSGIIKFRYNNTSAYGVKKFNQGDGFPDLRIRCGIPDRKDNIIFGTRTNGLFIFSATSDRFRHINTQNGLAANWVKSISIDEDNNLYAATNKGVNVFKADVREPIIRRLELSNATYAAAVNSVLAFKDSVFIGTDSGLITYFPRIDTRDTAHPPVYLTHLSINGFQDTAFNAYSTSHANYSLAHDRNVVAFGFSGVDLQGDRLTYSYMLKGQDDKWSEPDSRNFVSYNLPPGKYQFNVIAVSSIGIKSMYPATLSFTIRAPFWKTPWFLIACVLVAGLVIYLIYRYRIAQVIKIEKMRGRISADLHDDLGSGLSRIKFLSETIKLHKKQDMEFEKDLDKISDYSDEMAEKIGEIVWALNNKNDKLNDLIAYIRSYTMEYLTNHGISCQAVTPPIIPELIIDGETRRNLFLSVKEILFNLVKHAKAGEVTLTISINGSLAVIIHDDGIGIDLQNIRQFSNGLSNIKDRMRQSRGNALITADAGTRVVLTIPLDT